MIRVLRTEVAKLRRSLALLLCVAAPSMVAILSALMFTQRKGDLSWDMYVMSGAAIWSFFMLPMTVTALTVLVAQLEHGPRFWNHLLSLPVPRSSFFAAKLGVVVGLVAVMSVTLLLLLPSLAWLGDELTPSRALTGDLHLADFAWLLARMFAGALLLVVIQLWAALRFRSFVPPLVLGIGGTFVAVAATGSEYGLYFPWLIATNALASDPGRADLALAIGCIGGLIAGAAMLADLSRRDMA